MGWIYLIGVKKDNGGMKDHEISTEKSLKGFGNFFTPMTAAVYPQHLTRTEH